MISEVLKAKSNLFDLENPRNLDFQEQMKRDVVNLKIHYRPTLDKYIDLLLDSKNPYGQEILQNRPEALIYTLSTYNFLYEDEKISSLDFEEVSKNLFIEVTSIDIKNQNWTLSQNIFLARHLVRLFGEEASDIKKKILNYTKINPSLFVHRKISEENAYLHEMFPDDIWKNIPNKDEIRDWHKDASISNASNLVLTDIACLRIIDPRQDYRKFISTRHWKNATNKSQIDTLNTRTDYITGYTLAKDLETLTILAADEIIFTDHGIKCISHSSLVGSSQSLPKIKSIS